MNAVKCRVADASIDSFRRYVDEKDGHLPSISHANVTYIRADFQLPKKYEESRDSCSFFAQEGPLTNSTPLQRAPKTPWAPQLIQLPWWNYCESPNSIATIGC